MMRLILLLLALGLPGVGRAAPRVLDAEVVGDVVRALPGDIVEVEFLLANGETAPLHLNGISAAIDEGYALDDAFDPYEAWAPEILVPGESWEGPLLRLTLSPSLPLGVRVFEVTLFGGDHVYDMQPVATLYLAVDDSTGASGVEEPPSRAPSLHAGPNPFRGTLSIDFVLAAPGECTVSVFDVAGRLVTTLHDAATAPGPVRLTWDGRYASGRPAGRGVFFIRAEGPGQVLKTRVVRVE